MTTQRYYDERFDEIEDMLRYMGLRLGGQEQAPPGLQQTGLAGELHATSSDAWSQALKALDTLEDNTAQVVIQNGFSAGTSREHHGESASAESARRERSSS
jgi:hypothetical protein